MKKIIIAAFCCLSLAGAVAFANTNDTVKVAGNGGYVNVRV